jgi:hypothetical protein
MTITTAKLTRGAGLAAMVSGLLFVAIQPVHPAEEVATVTGNAWAVVGSMTLAFAVLGLVGVTGVYLRQVKDVGLLGLLGYLVFSLFFLLTTAYTFAETLVLPPLVPLAPEFVDSFLGVFSGSSGDVDLGAIGAIGGVAFLLYFVGGSLFGIALFRAAVLSRPAALLLVFGAVSTILVPLLPHAVGRYAAVPMGVALIWLGYSLWSDRRQMTADPVSHGGSAQLNVAPRRGDSPRQAARDSRTTP